MAEVSPPQINGVVLSGGNIYYTVMDSQARVASLNSPVFKNYGGNGAIIVINCTAIVTSPSVVFTVQGYDPTSDTYYDILVSAAIVAAGQTVLRIHPSLTAAANTIAKDFMPNNFRIKAVHANANSITYSVGVNLIK